MRCRSCRWAQRTTGLSKDLSGFREIKGSCSKCGKPRRFACPKCRGIAVMRREPQ